MCMHISVGLALEHQLDTVVQIAEKESMVELIGELQT